jgi:ferric-dicitrate binding protein FerR (iron transport regulator)
MTKHEHDEARQDAAMARLMRVAGARPTASAAARERARAAARGAWRESAQVRVRRRRLYLALPALAAAAIVVILILPRAGRQPVVPADVARLQSGTVTIDDGAGGPSRQAAPGDVVRAGDTLQTATGDLAALAMTGGGELRLNGATLVRLVDARRFALDRGQLYLDSGRAGGSALLVETTAGLVQDIGTRFDVALIDNQVRIRVREGAVRLAAGGRETDALAGQQIVASPGSAASVTAAKPYGPEWDWLARAAPFEIQGTTLDAFLRWVERDGGRTVVFLEPGLRAPLGKTRLHGSVRGLTTTEALDVILPASGLSYEINGDRIVIRREGSRR